MNVVIYTDYYEVNVGNECMGWTTVFQFIPFLDD